MFLRNGDCVESSKKLFCLVVDSNGNCLFCKGDVSYLDKTTSSCVEIAQFQRVVNCTVHSEPKKCSVCNPDFYVNPQSTIVDICLPVAVKTSNCQRYSAWQKCLECNSGYYLDEAASCQPLSSTQASSSQCNLFTPYRCNKCKQGSRLDTNAFSNYLQRNNLNNPVWASTVSQFDKSQLLISDWPVCFSTLNCRVYDKDINKCVQCDPEYSPDNMSGECVKNPLPRTIWNCDVYDSLNTCAVCKTGLLSFDRTQCLTGAELRGCLQHDLSLRAVRCIKCQPNWYLHYSGQCLLRLITDISNCESLSDVVDGCSKCKSGFDLTTDSTRCLPAQLNCLTYQVTSATSNELACDQCASGYYWSTVVSKCLLGSVPFCKTVLKSSNECSQCVDGYFLKDSVSCVKLIAVDNCDVSTFESQMDCNRCSPQNVKFAIVNKCISFAPIANCKNHNSSGSCAECLSGYSLSVGVCNQINWPNCAVFHPIVSQCETCQPGFVMNKANRLCSPLDPFFLTHCQPDTILGINFADSTTGCRECSPDKIPFDWKFGNMCSYPVQTGFQLNPLISPVFCQYYALNTVTQLYTCLKCAPGKHLTANGCEDTCVTSGGNPSYKITYAIRDLVSLSGATGDGYVQKDLCTKEDIGCEEMSPVYYANYVYSTVALDPTPYIPLVGTNIKYRCTKCFASKIPITSFTTSLAFRSSVSANDFGPAVTELNMFSTTIPIDFCVDSLPILWGTSVGGKIDKCSVYATFTYNQATSYSLNYCTKCNFGFTGVLRSIVSNCFEYVAGDLPKCAKCKTGFYLAIDFLSCIKILTPNLITGCLGYSVDKTIINCLKCDNTSHYQKKEAGTVGSTCLSRALVTTYSPSNCDRHNYMDRCYYIQPNSVLCPPIGGVNRVYIGTQCFNEILNCVDYETLTATPFYQCRTCASLYYLSGVAPKVCLLGTKENCIRYSFNENICIECNSAYFLNRGTCYLIANKNINNRTGFCASNGDTNCNECRYDTFRFQAKSLCRKTNGEAITITTSVSNCAVPLSTTTCSKCQSTHYLSNVSTCLLNNNDCSAMEPIDFSGDGYFDEDDYIANAFIVRCTACNSGFFLQSSYDKFTYKGAEVIVNKSFCISRSLIHGPTLSTPTTPFEFCQSFVLGDTPATHNYPSPTCNSCDPTQSYPISLEGKGACIRFTLLSGRLPVDDPNCMIHQYIESLKVYQCKICRPNFGLKDDNKCYNTIDNSKIILATVLTINPATKTISASSGNNLYWPRTGLNLPALCHLAVPPYLTLPTTTTVTYGCQICNSGQAMFTFPGNTFSYGPDLLSSFQVLIGLERESRSNFRVGFVNPTVRDCVAQAYYDTRLLATVLGLSNCLWKGTLRVTPDPRYGCLTCNVGYVGIVQYDDGTQIHRIIDCQVTPDLDSSKYSIAHFSTTQLRTVGSLHTIFSNTKCVDAAKMVFAFMILNKSGKEPTSVFGWGIYAEATAVTSTNPTLIMAGLVTKPSVSNLRCINPSTINANTYFIGAQVSVLVPNCALYIVDVTENLFDPTQSSTRKGVYCQACLPKFFPTYFESDTLMGYVTACTAMVPESGNPTSTTLNTITDCAYGMKVDSLFTNQLDYSKVDTRIINCLIYEGTGANTVCYKCRFGFMKSNDSKFCVAFLYPTSEQTYHEIEVLTKMGVVSLTEFPSRPDGLMVILQYAQYEGFYQCSSNNRNILVGKSDPLLFKQYCFEYRSYPTRLIELTTSIYSNADCQTYGWFTVNDSLKTGCIACKTNFVMLKDSNGVLGCCKNIGTFGNNCALYSNVPGVGDRCFTCKTGFLNVNSVCTDVTTLSSLSCATFNENLSKISTTAKCSSCNSSKPFLVNGDCLTTAGVQTTLPACSTGQTPCNPCAAGSVAIGTSVNSACIILDTSTNDSKCVALNSAEFKAGRIVCDVCDTGHYPQSTDHIPALIPWQCIQMTPLAPLTECSNFSATISSLTVGPLPTSCLNCSTYGSKYVLASSNQCVDRPTIAGFDPSKCVRFAADSLSCIACSAGFEAPYCTPPVPVGEVQTVINLPVQSNIRVFTHNNIPAYFETCSVAISDCNTSVFYHGLMSADGFVFSCHQCNTAGNIPYAFVREAAATAAFGIWNDVIGYGSYDFISTETTISPGNFEGGVGNVCHPLTYTFHPQYTASGSAALPANCALAMVRVLGTFASTSTSANPANGNGLSIFCSACKPLFKATLKTISPSTVRPYVVHSCVAISDCLTSKTFNQCDHCKSGFVFSGTSVSRILFDACVPHADINCFAVVSGACVLCDKGYFLNIDKICEPFNVPNCDNTVAHWHKPSTGGFNVYFTLTTLSTPGCQNVCNQGFIASYLSVTFLSCVESTYSKYPYANPTLFNRNCKTFKASLSLTGGIECNTCNSGFTLILELGACVQYSDPQCFIASTNGSCLQCATGYLLGAGKCILMNIANCQTHTVNGALLICSKCLESFSLQKNTCIQGTTLYCAEYDFKGKCIRCVADYMLSVDSTKKEVCVSVPRLNCQQFKGTSFDDFKIECETCKNQFKLSALSVIDQTNRCLPFGVNPNCQTYSLASKVSLSSLRCSKCADGFYFNPDDDVCVPRTTLNSSDCSILDPINDACLVKKSVSAVVNTSSTVVVNTSSTVVVNTSPTVVPLAVQPTGIDKCALYFNKTTCAKCQTTHYLKDNRCFALTDNNSISNTACVSFNSNQKCIECQEGFKRDDSGVCLSIGGAACQERSKIINNCVKCAPGYGLQSKFFDANCVLLNVDSCVKYSDIFPYDCILCGNNRYLNTTDKTCAPITRKVVLCSIYSADGVCAECLPGTVFKTVQSGVNGTANATVCASVVDEPQSSKLDPQCDLYEYSKSGYCSVCSSGNYLLNNQCVPCKAGKGCSICDSNDSSKCFICQSEYYQNENQQCVLNPPAVASSVRAEVIDNLN